MQIISIIIAWLALPLHLIATFLLLNALAYYSCNELKPIKKLMTISSLLLILSFASCIYSIIIYETVIWGEILIAIIGNEDGLFLFFSIFTLFIAMPYLKHKIEKINKIKNKRKELNL